MHKINLSKSQWFLYDTATEDEVAVVNAAANQAVFDVLAEMQKDGVTMLDALIAALNKAKAVCYQLADAGAYDGETMMQLESQVTRQFAFKR